MEELCGAYRIWWLTQTNPTHSPKLSTFRQFHPSFHQAPYLPTGPHYLRPQALRFRCSNHRLDIELGRHTNTPRPQRICRFCPSGSLGDEYHVFKCTHFLDLQIYCDIPNNIQAVLYLPYARLPHQGPKIYLPGYVQNTPPVNPPTLVASTNLPPPPPRPPLKPLVLNYYYYHTNTHCILCHIYIPTKPLIISC